MSPMPISTGTSLARGTRGSERALLCVTVAAPDMETLRAQRDGIREADLVELRLDAVDRPDVAGALEGRSKPVIVTCRSVQHGGAFRGPEEERRRLLREALQRGAEFVDLEWRAGMDEWVREREGRNIVLSMHDFARTPLDLSDRVDAMRATGAQVVKVAVTSHRLRDLIPLLRLGASPRAGSALVLIGMGAAGLASRILATRFGSAWTYAGTVAPGQLTADRMRAEFRFDRIGVATNIYGVVGRPLAHSISPAMHNAAFEAASVDAVYLPFEAVDAEDFLALADALAIRGASVTAPYKETLFRAATDVDPACARVGALNTLRRSNGKWRGTNTDIAGFTEPLAARFAVGGRRATILGAGGAARAVAVALQTAGAQVTVCARHLARAETVARVAGGQAKPFPIEAGTWDLLVNATPVGTFPEVDASPVPASALDGELVYDLVYNPQETRLLREARQSGCATLGGLEMLVAQAALQLEWWTGLRVERQVLRQAAQGRLAQAAREGA